MDVGGSDQHDVMRNEWGTITVQGGVNYFGTQHGGDYHRRRHIESLLDKLSFPEQSMRYEMIAEASHETCKWLFAEPQPRDGERPRYQVSKAHNEFSQFFRGSEKVFWVTGKPGSGKSCLMKYIATNDLTRQRLQHWHSSRPLSVFTHFFWRPGSDLQKNIQGFLRNLISQIWQDLADNQHDSKVIPPPLRQVNIWSLDWLLAHLVQLITALPVKFLLVIDGLDELDVEPTYQQRFLTMIRTLSSLDPIKICVSSRPELLFQDAFINFRSITMQAVNMHDMLLSADAQLSQFELFNQYKTDTPDVAQNLIQDLCERADGIFLWLRIALEDLCAGLQMHDDISQLRERMLSKKQGLFPLFRQMLSRQSPLYQAQFAMLCSQILKNGRVDSLDILLSRKAKAEVDLILDESFCNETSKSSLSRLAKCLREDERILEAQSVGLISSSCASSSESCSDIESLKESLLLLMKHFDAHTFTFPHRTIRDFFTEDDAARDFLAKFPASAERQHRAALEGIKISVQLCLRRVFDVAIAILRSLPWALKLDDPGEFRRLHWKHLSAVPSVKARISYLEARVMQDPKSFPYRAEYSTLASELMDVITGMATYFTAPDNPIEALFRLLQRTMVSFELEVVYSQFKSDALEAVNLSSAFAKAIRSQGSPSYNADLGLLYLRCAQKSSSFETDSFSMVKASRICNVVLSGASMREVFAQLCPLDDELPLKQPVRVSLTTGLWACFFETLIHLHMIENVDERFAIQQSIDSFITGDLDPLSCLQASDGRYQWRTNIEVSLLFLVETTRQIPEETRRAMGDSLRSQNVPNFGSLKVGSDEAAGSIRTFDLTSTSNDQDIAVCNAACEFTCELALMDYYAKNGGLRTRWHEPFTQLISSE